MDKETTLQNGYGRDTGSAGFNITVALPSGGLLALACNRHSDTVSSLVATLSRHPQLRGVAFYLMHGISCLSETLTLAHYNIQERSALRVLRQDALPGGGGAFQYMEQHQEVIEAALASVIGEVLQAEPPDPVSSLGQRLVARGAAASSELVPPQQSRLEVLEEQLAASKEQLAASKAQAASAEARVAAAEDREAGAEDRAAAAEDRAAAAEERAAAAEAKLASVAADTTSPSTGVPPSLASPGVAFNKPSGGHKNAPPCGPLLVCGASGAEFAALLLPHLGSSWELINAAVPEEATLAGASSVVVLLSEGSLDAPGVVFAMRCALAYGTPRMLVHTAESCEFGSVWPRANGELADVLPLYDKIAITMIGEYAKYAAGKVIAGLEEQQQEAVQSDEAGAADANEADVAVSIEAHDRSDEELAQMQAELLEGALPLLKALGIGFSVFLSHRRATGQGPIGRIYMDLKDDYRCFLDSEVTFKLHNLRALVQACNYFLFFLSGGILDQSPFCLEELLSAIHTKRTIFVVRDLQFKLPEDVKATVAKVMEGKLGAGSIEEHYGWSVDEAARRVADTLAEAWPTRITYQAEHFEPCMARIRERLGVPLASKLAEGVVKIGSELLSPLQPTPGCSVDFVGLVGLTELDLSKMELKPEDLSPVVAVLRASTCSLASLKCASVRVTQTTVNGVALCAVSRLPVLSCSWLALGAITHLKPLIACF